MWKCYLVRRRSRRFRLEYRFERAITFDPTVGWPSNVYRIFRKLFSFKYMWNRYLVRRRSRRFKLEYRFQRAITVDPTIGSLSNFYRSFRKPFLLS
jgi:hypothetical protein